MRTKYFSKLLLDIFACKVSEPTVSWLKREISRFSKSVNAIKHIWQTFHLEGWRWIGKRKGNGLGDVGSCEVMPAPRVSKRMLRTVSGKGPPIRGTL